MSDWIGLLVLLIPLIVAFVGLRLLSKNRQSTEQEFEQRASEGPSMSAAGIQAVNGLLNPSADKGREAIVEVKRGDYLKKKQGGKASGNESEGK